METQVFGLYNGEELKATYLSVEAAEVGRDGDENLEVRPLFITYPLDPLAYRNRRKWDERRSRMEKRDREWEFSPRPGFNRDSEAYGILYGGLDPLPYVIVPPRPGLVPKGRHRFASRSEKPSNAELSFDPRPGYETEEAKYL